MVALQQPGISRPLSLFRRVSIGEFWIYRASLTCTSQDVWALSTIVVSSHLMGPSTTPPNEQARILLRYLARWKFVSAHLNAPSASVRNSSHTYTSEAHHSSSTNDRNILCPKHFQSNLSHCRVYDENPLNLSDHLPVVGRLSCRMNTLTNSSPPSFIAPKPNWSRLRSSSEIADTYTARVQSALTSLSFPDASFSSLCPSQIDSHL